MRIAEQLAAMAELQDSLNRNVHAAWRTQGHQYYRAIWVECAELLDHFGWKWWKHQRPDLDQVKLEIVDIWHFGLSELIRDGSIDARPCRRSRRRCVRAAEPGAAAERFPRRRRSARAADARPTGLPGRGIRRRDGRVADRSRRAVSHLRGQKRAERFPSGERLSNRRVRQGMAGTRRQRAPLRTRWDAGRRVAFVLRRSVSGARSALRRKHRAS